SGGGAYIVALQNLGKTAGLTAAAALLIDYVLTVSVSIAAGVAAITSAFPLLYPWRVSLAAVCIAGIMLANLRGVRESGRVFAVPTYLFIASFFLLLAGGLTLLGSRGGTGFVPPGLVAPGGPGAAVTAVSVFVLLRAFASGCAALTGVEAIANGVQAFRPPEARNAALTLAWMAGILLTFFWGVTYLATTLGVTPREGETVVSQIARAIFGPTLPYYLIQASTAVILILAANTSFADFPRLSSILARDRFLPRQLANMGDRLVYSNGIVILGVLAILLVAIFGGETHALIAGRSHQRGGGGHDGARPRSTRRDEVPPGGLDRHPPHPVHHPGVPEGPPALPPHRIAADPGGIPRGAADRAHGGGARLRDPPGGDHGPALRRGHLEQCGGGHREPGPCQHRAPAEELGGARARGPPRRPRLPLPLGGGTNPGVHREGQGAFRAAPRDRGPAGVRPRALVGTLPAQPDGPGAQGRAPVQQGNYRDQRAAPPGALGRRSAGLPGPIRARRGGGDGVS
ncbi:MAG: APC family permease, partial [candidate division NC10 bacterium]|nr:APC family permease [candidate division NC10 bacterium]